MKTFNQGAAGATLALLFAAIGLLALPGCRNPFNASDLPADRAGTGTLYLTVGGPGLSRTIAPTWPDNSVRLELEFSNAAGGSYRPQNWDGSSPITLAAGDWTLDVQAFLIMGGPPADDVLIADGTFAITVVAGEDVMDTVTLTPASLTGTGRFAWDIAMDIPDVAGFQIETARMVIAPIDVDGLTHTFYFVGGSPPADWDYGIYLSPGRYRVVITVVNDRGERAVINEVLYIFSHLTSHFGETFGPQHFPRSLLDVILNAWDLAPMDDVNILWQWELSGMQVKWEHFVLLGIQGVDGANFGLLTQRFNDLSCIHTIPEDLTELKEMVDAGLVALGAAGISGAGHQTRQAVQYAVGALAANDSDIAFEWSGGSDVTVVIGAYRVPILFLAGNQILDFTLTFHANGGTLDGVSNGTYVRRAYDGQVLVLCGAAGLARPGYFFAGWNTWANGGGRLHPGNAPFAAAGTMTLYATWIRGDAVSDYYIVTLAPGDGTGTPVSLAPVPHDMEIILPAVPAEFTKPNHDFAGWYIEDTSLPPTGLRPAGAPFTVDGTVTMIAQWQPMPPTGVPGQYRPAPVYTVTLRRNGGVGAEIEMSVPAGAEIALPAGGFIWQWHGLEGWSLDPRPVNDSPDLGMTPGSGFTVDADTVLYAVWSRYAFGITFNANSGIGTPPPSIMDIPRGEARQL
ncbi:MAG: InlB B-repeat-containing protein, partial [Treponema sp.]|nr:InlB B-repeat-containing protein [Treponema sp.]